MYTDLRKILIFLETTPVASSLHFAVWLQQQSNMAEAVIVFGRCQAPISAGILIILTQICVAPSVSRQIRFILSWRLLYTSLPIHNLESSHHSVRPRVTDVIKWTTNKRKINNKHILTACKLRYIFHNLRKKHPIFMTISMHILRL